MSSIKKMVDVNLTASDIAQIFCNMDAAEQAMFFNAVGRIASEWENPFEFQMAEVERSNTLTNRGRNIMKLIGEYSAEKVTK